MLHAFVSISELIQCSGCITDVAMSNVIDTTATGPLPTVLWVSNNTQEQGMFTPALVLLHGFQDGNLKELVSVIFFS